MQHQGTRGQPSHQAPGVLGSPSQVQAMNAGMHRHTPGPGSMPGTGPTNNGGQGGARPDGGQDGLVQLSPTPDGTSRVPPVDGEVNSGSRAPNDQVPLNDMTATGNNANANPDIIDLINFLGGPEEC